MSSRAGWARNSCGASAGDRPGAGAGRRGEVGGVRVQGEAPEIAASPLPEHLERTDAGDGPVRLRFGGALVREGLPGLVPQPCDPFGINRTVTGTRQQGVAVGDDVAQRADDEPQGGHEELRVPERVAKPRLGVQGAFEFHLQAEGGEGVGRRDGAGRARVAHGRGNVLGGGGTKERLSRVAPFAVLLGGQARGPTGDPQELPGERP